LGGQAVLRVTGPVAYTQAIYPNLAGHDYTLFDTQEEAGFIYSCFGKDNDGFHHARLDPKAIHYSSLQDKLIL
jgi:hypothetical protein